jgi:hypothetical protein
MRTVTKLLGYGLILAVVFGSAWAIGTTAGPQPIAHSHALHAAGPPAPAVNTTGYRLDFDGAEPGSGSIRFRVIGTDGQPVTKFLDTEDGIRLRLTLTDAGTSPARPVYPSMSPDGTWTAPLIPAPGTYRVIADFTPDGGPHTALTTTVHFG